MTVLGNLALWIALLIGLGGARSLSFPGRGRAARTSRGRAALGLRHVAALLVSRRSRWDGLFAHDFSIEYVAAYTSRNLPVFYTWSAFYAGQKGSLLFWAIVLSDLRRRSRSCSRTAASTAS